MKSDILDFNEVSGDMDMPKMVDHLTQMRLYQKVREMFTKEIAHIEKEAK